MLKIVLKIGNLRDFGTIFNIFAKLIFALKFNIWVLTLRCPQNSVIRNEGQRETCASNVGVASNLDCLSSIHNHTTSILSPKSSIIHTHKSSLSNLNSQLSIPFSPSSLKSTVYSTQNVLKIAWFPTKCPQAPLAPLAAFSRSGLDTKKWAP